MDAETWKEPHLSASELVASAETMRLSIQGAALYTKGEVAQLTRPLGAMGVAGVDSISLAGFEATETRDLGERTAGATRLSLNNGLATELYLARSSGLGSETSVRERQEIRVFFVRVSIGHNPSR